MKNKICDNCKCEMDLDLEFNQFVCPECENSENIEEKDISINEIKEELLKINNNIDFLKRRREGVIKTLQTLCKHEEVYVVETKWEESRSGLFPSYFPERICRNCGLKEDDSLKYCGKLGKYENVPQMSREKAYKYWIR